MFDRTVYFPILKTKASEVQGLAQLEEEVMSRVTPIFDVVPIYRYQKNIPTLDKHLTDIAKKISFVWKYERPVILDLFELPLELRTSGGIHPLSFLTHELQVLNISIVPTTGLERDADYNNQVRLIHREQGNGILIRLLNEDLIAPTIMLQELEDLIKELGVSKNDIDLLIDLRQMLNQDLNHYVGIIVNAVSYISDLDQFRTIIISGSSMPKSIAEQVQPSSSKMIRRLEMDVWQSIIENEILEVEPVFSDYTIINPEYVDIDPRIYANTMGPSIRYTTDTHWFITRGKSFSNHPEGHRQYYSLAREVVNHPNFMGSNYSYGDRYIDDKANEVGGPGIPWHWLRAGINHHISLLVDSLI